MKFKLKKLLLACALLLCLGACEQTDPLSSYKIEGSWILQAANGDSIATTQRVVLILNDKDQCTFARRYTNGNSYNSQWAVSDQFKWEFHGTILELSGTDYQGNVWAQLNTFRSVDDRTLKFIVHADEVPGTLRTENIYASSDYLCSFSRFYQNSDHVGTWQCLKKDSTEITDTRIAIQEGGTLTVQKLENEVWTDHSEYAATIFNYGDFIAINYTENDSLRCDTWDTALTSSNDSTIWTWTNKAANDTIRRYTFNKIN